MLYPNRLLLQCGEEGHMSYKCPQNDGSGGDKRGCFKVGERQFVVILLSIKLMYNSPVKLIFSGIDEMSNIVYS